MPDHSAHDLGVEVDDEAERRHIAGGEEANHKRIEEALKKTFRPEFVNRIDEIIIFEDARTLFFEMTTNAECFLLTFCPPSSLLSSMCSGPSMSLLLGMVVRNAGPLAISLSLVHPRA